MKKSAKTETFLDGRVSLMTGDCLERLKEIPDNSIDSCVTDPPYHLTSIVKRFGAENAAPAKAGKTGAYARASAGFMGKKWDGGDIAFRPEVWAEILRVLKPGGYLAAFGAPRNFGRLQVAIFDAGFEERDTILNMVDPDDPICQFLESLSSVQADAFINCLANSELSGILAWIFGSGFPKSHNLSKAFDRLAGADRKIIGTSRQRDIRNGHGRGVGDGLHASSRGSPEYIDLEITAPATALAQEWNGWGTALKPAFEPIVVARKPISEKSVAENVMRWRTGALNIDGCRIGTEGARNNGRAAGTNGIYGHIGATTQIDYGMGRWPANITHDGSEAIESSFPDAPGQLIDASSNPDRRKTQNVYGTLRSGRGGEASADRNYADQGSTNFAMTPGARRGDSGSASRFFYNSKAGADDRIGSKHPTVKPVDLDRWLVRLLTPPGGTTLDPFAGTGTTGEAAWREGMNAVLIEREEDSHADIRRRMALCLSGTGERSRASAKAKQTGKEPDLGPLFTAPDLSSRK